VIQIGPYKIWNFNTPNRGFGNVAVVEGEKELVVIDTTTAIEHATVAASACAR
jgi:alkyl sulfatase BDS1-like metallo-beta-lactamase superfamily hydrolase